MTSINSIIELTEMCKKNDIEMVIDESGVAISAYRNGKKMSRHYDLKTINIISLNHSIQIIIDTFREEFILQFNRAVG